MKSFGHILLGFVCFIGCFVAASFAGPKKGQSLDSMEGVKGVNVVLDYDAPPELADGLTESQLQAEVELQLSANGVKVLKGDQREDEPGKPYLYVNVIGTQLDSEGRKLPEFLYTFSAAFIQNVTLDRRPRMRVEGSTWSQGYSALVSKNSLRTITVKVGDLAYKFVQAYKSANHVR